MSTQQTSRASQTGRVRRRKSKDRPDPSTQYWCEVLGMELGPMPYADAVKLIHDGELGQTDKIRTSANGEWSKVLDLSEFRTALKAAAAEIAEEVLAASSATSAAPAKDDSVDATGDSTVTEIPVAAPAPAAASAPAPESKSEPTPKPDPTPEPAASEPAPAAAVPPPAMPPQPAAPSRPPVKKPAPSRDNSDRRRVLALSAAVIAGVGLLGGGVWAIIAMTGGPPAEAREWCDQLMAIHKKHVSMREGEAPGSEWNSFATESQSKADHMVPILIDTASTEQPALQHLLWASRDYLGLMIKDCREEAGGAELSFEEHVLTADRILRGVSLDDPPTDTASSDGGNSSQAFVAPAGTSEYGTPAERPASGSSQRPSGSVGTVGSSGRTSTGTRPARVVSQPYVPDGPAPFPEDTAIGDTE